jgi:two-component system, chemotaxis family, chemotaxis protein CheY
MGDPRKILLVDDSATIRQLLKFGLSRVPNTSCDEAADGSQALKLAEKTRYELVLADINMPVMDGLKMLEELRLRPEYKDVPVVMITTEGAAADQQKAMEKGATAYLTKPVQIPKFLEVVRTYLK